MILFGGSVGGASAVRGRYIYIYIIIDVCWFDFV